MTSGEQDLGSFSMLDLFRMEVETQAAILNENLLTLETNPNAPEALEALMRAAHSIKGAGRIVQLDAAVKVAHAMEDCFVAAQEGAIAIYSAEQIDVLLQGVDLLLRIAQVSETELENWLAEHNTEIENLAATIAAIKQEIGTEETQEDLQTISPEPLTPTPQTNKPLDISSLSMLGLFRMEVENYATSLQNTLLALKNNLDPAQEGAVNTGALSQLESLRHAAHSIKGAARIVQLNGAVVIAYALENCFVVAGQKNIALEASQINILLQGVDLLLRMAQVSETEIENWLTEHQVEIENVVATIFAIRQETEEPLVETRFIASETRSQGSSSQESAIIAQNTAIAPATPPLKGTLNTEQRTESKIQNLKSKIQTQSPTSERVVRVSAENLNRLMGLAGESLVEANWLQPFADSLLKLRKRQVELSNLLEKLQESLSGDRLDESTEERLNSAIEKASDCREILSDRLSELELFARRSANLSDRLYREVIATHMRPFGDGVQGFPRMVRDLARLLGKQVKLEITGKSTKVDRDIAEKLEAPLTHMLQNAIDHGIESPGDRLATGKPAEGTVRVEATHRAGMLWIIVSDDGRGVDLDPLRQKIVQRNLVTAQMAAQLTETELMEFLFLPGFSTANGVTEISGRGVGLDVVQRMVQEVGGVLRAVSQPGKGMSFYLQLPLTLSVVRTLLVEISGEPYAFPLTRLERIVMVPRSEIEVVENRQFFRMDGENIGLVATHQVLELKEYPINSEALQVVVVGDRTNRYGLVVDSFLGERDLVVRPLDPRLGKVKDISAAALMEDGSPVLIVDVEDIVQSINNLLASGQLSKVSSTVDTTASKIHKRILVVDDSITVREVERKLLENHGYEVEVAVNGMDGWNAVRTGHYDLIITDIDMPRMNGIELVSLIKNHHNLKSLPVIVVSYKDREEDRIRGMEAGANYYLTKSSFHDDTLLNAVLDLIGN